MCLQEVGREGMEWIYVVEDRDMWRAPVNTVMNLWVPVTADKLKTRVIKPTNSHV